MEIDLVLPQKTDFLIFDWALESQLGLMDLKRINCYRSQEPFDHSKLVTVDGIWCAIGSPNWDVRSMRLNFEILVECHDQETVGKMQEIITRKLQGSLKHEPLTKSRTNLLFRLRNAGARLMLPYF